MLQKSLDAMREYSHEDKRAIAASVAFVVVFLLVVVWSYFFFRTATNAGTQDLPAQTASAAAVAE